MAPFELFIFSWGELQLRVDLKVRVQFPQKERLALGAVLAGEFSGLDPSLCHCLCGQ